MINGNIDCNLHITIFYLLFSQNCIIKIKENKDAKKRINLNGKRILRDTTISDEISKVKSYEYKS